jgi:hypothetical protein
MEHENENYIGQLTVVDDKAFCQRIVILLQANIGRSIREVGDIEIAWEIPSGANPWGSFRMDARLMINYLRLIEKYLYADWLNTRDPQTKAEIEIIAAQIADLKKRCE